MARVENPSRNSRGGSRVDEVFAWLRTQILTGRLVPGTPLRTAGLAKELEVSLSVVRESLVRLTEKGLAESSPNQGFRVVSISAEDLVDLTEVRVLLESQVLERSIARGDLEWEARVVSTHHVLDSLPLTVDADGTWNPAWAKAHEDFHDSLGLGCGSPRLIDMVRSLRDSSEIYRQLAGPRGAETGRDIRAEHREIMELATRRDAPKAASALQKHLERTTELLLELTPTQS